MAAGVGHDQEAVLAAANDERTHQLVVAAVEAFGHTQHGRKPLHRAAPALAERRVNVVAPLARPRSTMVLGDGCDDGDLLGGESAQSAVPDDVGRMLRMTVLGDRRADVVEQGRVVQPFALAVAESVPRLQLLE